MYNRNLGFFAVILQLFFSVPCGLAIESPQIVDLIPQELYVLADSKGDSESRGDRFTKEVVDVSPEVYRRLWHLNPAFAKDYLPKALEYVPSIRRLRARFQNEEPAVLDRFCQMFPDFVPAKVKIYLMLSLFRFDAKIPSEHPESLLIGLDGLARFHGADAPLPVILSHEFFHLYHFQVNPLPKNPDELPLYRLLWQEGLAVYVSQQLNSGASLADVLLDPKLATGGPATISTEAKRLLTCLESREDEVAAHFLAKNENGEVPGRIGYLIGYQIVSRLAEKHPISRLARLRDPGLRFTFRRELYRLAYP